MKEEIKKLIEEYSEEAVFTGKISSDEIIESSIEELKVNIPDDYRWFIKNYGQGGIGGVEILGISRTNKAIFKDTTLEYRNYGLPINLVVVENCDEWLYCIDTDTEKVIAWNRIDGILGDRYTTFLEFLLDRFNDEIENM
ncbi:SMI1/KNR4 family protein [Clostridium sp.]|uniref:SMI1/KNR4 family protein n=1 Tax=Clostridium sp. TaxID=1506 RepID=UPI001EBDDE48|nr:SMI1/KNR4 family protein [Clostridium sp.]MBS5886889.1 SMI1/KNR4 family protein [Clostridium sp.]